jgi:hypothetical protein
MSRIDAAPSSRRFAMNTAKSRTETLSAAAARDEGLLREDELDAVSGGRAGGDKVKYMEIKMKEILISSV